MNDYYIKETDIDHLEYSDSHKRETFSKNELNIIASVLKFSLFDKYKYDIEYCGYVSSRNCLAIRNHDVIWENAFIYKYPDEWYAVEFILYKNSTREYYLCDQFDGLLKCMEDKSNNIG